MHCQKYLTQSNILPISQNDYFQQECNWNKYLDLHRQNHPTNNQLNHLYDHHMIILKWVREYSYRYDSNIELFRYSNNIQNLNLSSPHNFFILLLHQFHMPNMRYIFLKLSSQIHYRYRYSSDLNKLFYSLEQEDCHRFQ